MSKAIISNRIYLRIPPEGPEDIKKALTYKIETKTGGARGKFKAIEIIRNYKIVSPTVISIPQGREDLIPTGYTVEDRRVTHEVPFPNPEFELRPGQQDVFDMVEGSCLINALVGWGRVLPHVRVI